MNNRWPLIGALFVGAVVGAGGVTYFVLVPRTFDECIMQEMRQQQQAKMFQADSICSRRFHLEMSISSSDYEVAWTHDPVHVIINVISPKAEITKGEFLFSTKNCDESKYDDFKQSQTGVATNNKFILDKVDPPPVCMKTISIYGKYQ